MSGKGKKKRSKHYRIALRPDHRDPSLLDDVVVKDVSMFRAEDMGDWWWLCCYLDGEDDGNRITWHLSKKGELTTIEYPHGVVYEAGSLAPHHLTPSIERL